MAYVGWSSVANQVNTTTGAALDVNGQVTSSFYFGAGVGGEGATNLMLAPSLNLNFALFGQTTLDPRIDFRRTTNATVTNSAGVITYAPHNLLLASEAFDNTAWAKTKATITANVIAAPNGTITADKFILDTTAATTHILATAITQVVATYTFSIYAKAAELSQIYLNNGATNTGAYFNLSTGIATPNSGITATIEPVGDGWYRCAITYLSTAASISNRCYLAQDGLITFATADGVSGLYIWGAQLEIGSTATTYNSTTVKNLLGYSELFDNAAWTKSNSFVQTNLLTYSEAFDNAASWSKPSTTVSANISISPNNYQTADLITATTPGNSRGVYQSFSASALTYTFSFYAKAAGLNYITFYDPAGTGLGIVWFNLVTGAVETTTSGYTASIYPALNGFYRCTVTTTLSAGTKYYFIGGVDADNSITASSTISGVYIWGAQLVQGSVAGDYRRTDAAALPVYYANHNGVVCAEKLVENTVNGVHAVTISGGVTGAVMTASVYAKAGERTQLTIQASTGTVYYNLATGTIISGSNASIVSVGNGWYRCSVTTTFTANITTNIYVANSGVVTYTGDGTSGIYIFGAQLSDSASLDPYVLNAAAAPTAAAYYGARFDYDPVTLQPKGLLIEEQRSNLLPYSSEFDNGAWQKTASTITANTIISPDGTLTADKLVENSASGIHYAEQGASTTAIAYTLSIYCKAAERGWCNLAERAGTVDVYFDLINGAVGTITGSATASITPVGNGWYRCAVTLTSAGGSKGLAITTATANNTRSYTGDGTSGIYIWGAQLEAGAFATSYIPTAASQVTRAADVATIQGSNFYSWYNQNEGNVYVQAMNANASASMQALAFSDNTGNNTMRIKNTSNNFTVVANGNGEASLSVSSIASYKASAAYKVNDFAFAQNNSTVVTDTAGIVPIINRLYIGVRGDGGFAEFANGTIKQISYYPQRLSNDVLVGLTR